MYIYITIYICVCVFDCFLSLTISMFSWRYNYITISQYEDFKDILGLVHEEMVNLFCGISGWDIQPTNNLTRDMDVSENVI